MDKASIKSLVVKSYRLVSTELLYKRECYPLRKLLCDSNAMISLDLTMGKHSSKGVLCLYETLQPRCIQQNVSDHSCVLTIVSLSFSFTLIPNIHCFFEKRKTLSKYTINLDFFLILDFVIILPYNSINSRITPSPNSFLTTPTEFPYIIMII